MKNSIVLTIQKTGINGEGIAYLKHKPVFIPHALVDETVSVTLCEENDTYARAKVNSILKPSPMRITPSCSRCEGCALNFVKEEQQLAIKKDILSETLYKYARIPSDLVRSVHTDHIHKGIRSQCKLPVGEVDGKLVSGLYETGTNRFIPIEDCPMHTPDVERIRKEVLRLCTGVLKAYDPKRGHGLRYLIIRSLNGQGQCTLVTGRDEMPAPLVYSLSHIAGLTGLFQSINTEKKGTSLFGSSIRKLAGADWIETDLNGLKLRLSPRSFFQLNVPMAAELYRTATGKIDPCDVLVEAYCGIGAMSLLAHDKANTVIGIESVSEAIENADANARTSGIENCHFFTADAAEGLQNVLARMPVDTLLADPPRAGMDQAMIQTILSSSITKIIYVSCNPATLAKNLHALAGSYHPVTIIPFDLFPDTPHVESITVLVRNGMHDSKKKKYRKKKKNAVSLQQRKQNASD